MALFILILAVPACSWLFLRVLYPSWNAHRRLARARTALPTATLDDDRLLEAVAGDIARLRGRRPVRDRRVLSEPMGEGASDWVLTNAPRQGKPEYVVEPRKWEPIRVLDADHRGPVRVVFRVQVRLSIPGRLSVRRKAVAYWTYMRATDGWNRWAVEDRWQGRRHLHALPDDVPGLRVRLHDEAVIEQAAAETAPAEIAAAAGDTIGGAAATRAALDIAAADQRYAPGVVQACVERTLAAWEMASNGDDDALRPFATPNAIHELLHPSRRTGGPSKIREPVLRDLKLVELNTNVAPTRATVLLTISAAPDVRRFETHWRLRLTDRPDIPWQVESAEAWNERYLFSDT